MRNLDQTPRLISEKPPVCHNSYTMCDIRKRIPRCTFITSFKIIPKVSALLSVTMWSGHRLRSNQTQIIKHKGNNFNTWRLCNSRHSKTFKLIMIMSDRSSPGNAFCLQHIYYGLLINQHILVIYNQSDQSEYIQKLSVAQPEDKLGPGPSKSHLCTSTCPNRLRQLISSKYCFVASTTFSCV